jgi:predicted amidophosphoribosyltransferase
VTGTDTDATGDGTDIDRCPACDSDLSRYNAAFCPECGTDIAS